MRGRTSRRAAGIVGIGLWLVATKAATAEHAGDATVVVRISHLVMVPPEDRHAARDTVRDIFGHGGIAIVWRECAGGAIDGTRFSDTCGDPLTPTDVLVRLVAPPPRTPEGVLGFSYVEQGAGISRLATVYPERIARLAQGTGVTAAVLVGRVIAHEVGHLLLGTTGHADEGLMRAHWTSLELVQPSGRAWTFSVAEAAAMRRALASTGARATDLARRQ